MKIKNVTINTSKAIVSFNHETSPYINEVKLDESSNALILELNCKLDQIENSRCLYEELFKCIIENQLRIPREILTIIQSGLSCNPSDSPSINNLLKLLTEADEATTPETTSRESKHEEGEDDTESVGEEPDCHFLFYFLDKPCPDFFSNPDDNQAAFLGLYLKLICSTKNLKDAQKIDFEKLYSTYVNYEIPDSAAIIAYENYYIKLARLLTDEDYKIPNLDEETNSNLIKLIRDYIKAIKGLGITENQTKCIFDLTIKMENNSSLREFLKKLIEATEKIPNEHRNLLLTHFLLKVKECQDNTLKQYQEFFIFFIQASNLNYQIVARFIDSTQIESHSIKLKKLSNVIYQLYENQIKDLLDSEHTDIKKFIYAIFNRICLIYLDSDKDIFSRLFDNKNILSAYTKFKATHTNFQFESILGSGTFGIAISFHNSNTNERRVLKLSHLSKQNSEEEAKKELAREAFITREALLDENTLVINDHSYSMSMVPGETIHKFFSTHKLLPVVEHIKIYIKLIDALTDLYQCGYIHGDLNLANAIYNHETKKCRLIDPGSAQRIGDEVSTMFIPLDEIKNDRYYPQEIITHHYTTEKHDLASPLIDAYALKYHLTHDTHYKTMYYTHALLESRDSFYQTERATVKQIKNALKKDLALHKKLENHSSSIEQKTEEVGPGHEAIITDNTKIKKALKILANLNLIELYAEQLTSIDDKAIDKILEITPNVDELFEETDYINAQTRAHRIFLNLTDTPLKNKESKIFYNLENIYLQQFYIRCLANKKFLDAFKALPQDEHKKKVLACLLKNNVKISDGLWGVINDNKQPNAFIAIEYICAASDYISHKVFTTLVNGVIKNNQELITELCKQKEREEHEKSTLQNKWGSARTKSPTNTHETTELYLKRRRAELNYKRFLLNKPIRLARHLAECAAKTTHPKPTPQTPPAVSAGLKFSNIVDDQTLGSATVFDTDDNLALENIKDAHHKELCLSVINILENIINSCLSKITGDTKNIRNAFLQWCQEDLKALIYKSGFDEVILRNKIDTLSMLIMQVKTGMYWRYSNTPQDKASHSREDLARFTLNDMKECLNEASKNIHYSHFILQTLRTSNVIATRMQSRHKLVSTRHMGTEASDPFTGNDRDTFKMGFFIDMSMLALKALKHLNERESEANTFRTSLKTQLDQRERYWRKHSQLDMHQSSASKWLGRIIKNLFAIIFGGLFVANLINKASTGSYFFGKHTTRTDEARRLARGHVEALCHRANKRQH